MRKHGSYVRYVQGPDIDGAPGKGCRCESCREANRAYERERSARIEPPYISAGPAREHAKWLASQGVGLKTLAKRSGVPHGSLSKLIYGDPKRNMAPSKRIRPRTAERILAVMPTEGAEGARVPAGPTWEIVDQLRARGWTKTAIARAIGQKVGGLQLGTEYVTRRNAAAVRDLLDQPIPERRGSRGQVLAPERPAPRPVVVQRSADDALKALAEIMEARLDQASWRQRAACRGRPSWLWFPARGDHDTAARAMRVCGACPVRAECAAAHIDERDGIFGGMSAAERRRLRAA